MTDRIIRIKASRQPYRRAGLDLGAQWLEVDTSSLSLEQQRALLQDVVLTIEGHNDDGAWMALSGELRAGLLAVLDIDAGRTFLEDEGVTDSLASAILLNVQDLFVLGISVAEDRHHLVIPELVELITTERAQFATAVEGYDAAIADLTAQVDGQAEQMAAFEAAKNDTAPDRTAIEGGGDPAAPPPGPDAAPATGPDPAAGSGGPAGGEATPSPSALKGGKPAKSKAD